MNMQTRSIFSLNTHISGPKGAGSEWVEANPLHQYFYRMLPTFSKECPYLSKLLFLHLLLRQNMVIYTEDRVDARDIWLSISRALDQKKPHIYVTDEQLDMQHLLTHQNQYQRVLLFDVHKLTVENINKMHNSDLRVSMVGIETPSINIGSHITDFFSLVCLYTQEQTPIALLESFNQEIQVQSARAFNKTEFNESIKLNFEVVIKQNEDEGFIKPFLQCFAKKLDQSGIKVSQSRWKTMLRMLRFIGVNKHEGSFKRLSLGDFILSPEFLAVSLNQLQTIQQLLYEVLLAFVPYYGIQKFQKSFKNHFWFSKTHFQLSLKILQFVNKNTVSFFYPCLKFPSSAGLQADPLSYWIQGQQKKLMSDHHIEVDSQRKYVLTMSARADWIACYDKMKNIILPVQACRKEGSAVHFVRLSKDGLVVRGKSGLREWNNEGDSFAYEKAIGVYFNQGSNQVIPASQLLYNPKAPYSKGEGAYLAISMPEQQTEEGEIILSLESRQWFKDHEHLLEVNKTVLMNHFEGGVGCIGVTARLEKGPSQHLEATYQGQQWGNTGKNFFPGTKYIRVVVMVNYCEFQSNQVENKNGVFQFTNVLFKSC